MEAVQGSHVSLEERVNLAAGYRPRVTVDCEETNPLVYSVPHLHGNNRLPCSVNYGLSAPVQMSSAYSLPNAYPDYGFQEGRPLTPSSPHFRALLLCPIRSLFRIVGSLGSTSGGIIRP
jgi:hypothetical protein